MTDQKNQLASSPIKARVQRLGGKRLNPTIVEIAEISRRAASANLYFRQGDVAENIDLGAVGFRKIDILDDRYAFFDHVARTILLVRPPVDD